MHGRYGKSDDAVVKSALKASLKQSSSKLKCSIPIGKPGMMLLSRLLWRHFGRTTPANRHSLQMPGLARILPTRLLPAYMFIDSCKGYKLKSMNGQMRA
ncbi:unnamed protein product [Protopolystoma xenopodis]|uniref:Uncharacterized protein n=1 Tax=Protopolystoma xenopodis TaxID=117903 RepID=A0A3S5AC08_9PLAT|nr:unnamed protein product [Protopolystoma xenopodis]